MAPTVGSFGPSFVFSGKKVIFGSWQLTVGRWQLAGGSWQVVVSRKQVEGGMWTNCLGAVRKAGIRCDMAGGRRGGNSWHRTPIRRSRRSSSTQHSMH